MGENDGDKQVDQPDTGCGKARHWSKAVTGKNESPAEAGLPVLTFSPGGRRVNAVDVAASSGNILALNPPKALHRSDLCIGDITSRRPVAVIYNGMAPGRKARKCDSPPGAGSSVTSTQEAVNGVSENRLQQRYPRHPESPDLKPLRIKDGFAQISPATILLIRE